jgi:hypothetical protein
MSLEKSAQNPQFERSFADLAYAIIKDKAPRLLDYMVGFQVVDKNEDETKASGVFGFKVGRQWFYAPVFFLNGDLKGSELLYIKEQDTFVPLQENWVNYLINRKPVTLGEPTPYTEQELNVSAPNFRVFSRSPIRNSFTKLSAAEYDPARANEVHGYWRIGEPFDIYPAMRCFRISPASPAFDKAAARMDLRRVVKDVGEPARRYLARLMEVDPEVKSAMLNLYDELELFGDSRPIAIVAKPVTDDMLKDAGVSREEFNWHIKRAAQGIKPFPNIVRLLKDAGVPRHQDVAAVLPQLLSKPVTTTTKESSAVVKIRILTPETLDYSYTDDEKSEVMREGYAVRDSRAPEEMPEVYDGDDMPDLTTPSGSGVYTVLTSDQSLRSMLLLTNPVNIGRGVYDQCVMVDCADRSWDCSAPDAVYVMKEQQDQAGWHSLYAGLAGVQSMEEGKAYCIVGPDGIGSAPFLVASRSGNDLQVIQHDLPNCERTIMLDGKSTSLKGIGSMLVCPAGYKCIDIASARGLSTVPGSECDARAFTTKGAECVNVWSNCGRFQIEHNETLSEAMTKQSATVALIERFQLNKKLAEDMLSTSVTPGYASFLIKGAQDPSMSFTPPTAALDYTQAYDPELGVPVQEPVSYMDTNPGYDQARNIELYNPLGNDPSLQRAVSVAGQTGQKEVFDTSVLSSLVRMVDVDPVVDKYLGDLVIGEDRLGRILFLSYWHNDKFEDRYGETELRELEDTLKNAFKSVGDLILFLKKKTIEPEADLMGSDVELEG